MEFPLTMDHLRSVESNVSRAEHPAGLPAPEHHRNQEEPRKIKRRRSNSMEIRPRFTSQFTENAETETEHTVQENQNNTIITHSFLFTAESPKPCRAPRLLSLRFSAPSAGGAS
ncbi:hypothetical protein PGIGA_G00193950 [Pangasianodon gigas]|uniref:Uncharacterized protein n=1 Tax=Pangasianodon gigas TaxID=30993 RepID=A0ACC5WE48_PANGG|nr:hypothetical protein [Pangasianodon gigas]